MVNIDNVWNKTHCEHADQVRNAGFLSMISSSLSGVLVPLSILLLRLCSIAASLSRWRTAFRPSYSTAIATTATHDPNISARQKYVRGYKHGRPDKHEATCNGSKGEVIPEQYGS